LFISNIIHSEAVLVKLCQNVAGVQFFCIFYALVCLGIDVYGGRDKFEFLWVEDFPLFLPKEDGTAGKMTILCYGFGYKG